MGNTESHDQCQEAIPFFEGSRQQQAALIGLEQSYRAPHGLAVITAPRGAGVTALTRELLRRLKEESSGDANHPDAATIDAHQTTVAGVLVDILDAFGYQLPDASHTELLSMTRVVALHQAERGTPPLIIFKHVDKASPKVMEIIIELAGIRHGPRSACRIILSGSPLLEKMIKAEKMGPVAKRVTFHAQLGPFDESARKAFIEHLLNSYAQDAHSNAFDNMIRLGDGLPGTIVDVILRARDLVRDGRPLESGDVLLALEGHTAAMLERRAKKVASVPDDPADSTQIRKITFDESRPVPFDDGGSVSEDNAPFGEILVNCNGELLQRYVIERRKVLIGRASHNDIMLDSKWVSRHHAIIICHEHGASLVDINSTNGMTVNSRQVRQQALMNKDIIVIGDYRLKYLNDKAGRALTDDEQLTDTRMLRTISGESPEAEKPAKAKVRKRSKRRK